MWLLYVLLFILHYLWFSFSFADIHKSFMIFIRYTQIAFLKISGYVRIYIRSFPIQADRISNTLKVINCVKKIVFLGGRSESLCFQCTILNIIKSVLQICTSCTYCTSVTFTCIVGLFPWKTIFPLWNVHRCGKTRK